MNSKLVITTKENRIITSLLENDTYVQLRVDAKDSNSLLGNIYVGKVKNIVKNINAAFIEVADGIMCYYSLEENKHPIYVKEKKTDKLVIGDEILVQIEKENIKTKAPVATCHLNFTGKYVVLTHGKTKIGVSSKITSDQEKRRLREILSPYENDKYGFIIRTNAKGADQIVLEKEIASLVQLYEKVTSEGIHRSVFSVIYKTPADYLCDIRDGYANALEEIITDDAWLYEQIKDYLLHYQQEDLEKLRLYDDPTISLNTLYNVEKRIEEATREHVWLKSGAYLIIQHTEAFNIIDVNTGKAISGKKKAQETFLKINLEAAKEAARQIRLRNLSGIIIIDFIDLLDKNDQELLMKELTNAFKADPVKTTVVDITALNLVEITRKKVRKPLHEQLQGL
ncbi:ribonuclease E/G [Anaerosporobacter faecicola]|uniref:ribonuclease E/G n=1 Tax=Anaerosporobacter faecicola TaxID=2718714 RepID=UPI00143A2FC3|nr:ribonuclease E/G [Anaerosporobacter faecicola]